MLQIIDFTVILPVLMLAILLTLIRLIKGPTLSDRVVALDLMTTLGIGVIAAYAIAYNEPIFLDVALIVALVSFLGTIAFAYYVEKGTK
ncbi:MAG TPA: cation:proton antiporter [Anaerolineae bacterium]|nr:cation:proton antiporter [Anaerolineae bacterium]MCB0178142.1 cation:proton antiporter [Anaerolineae bacterium]MCB0222180.1 cation:proton antiporter [Anaerolineae bacterium]MCB9102892.1 cation:proton antiporter [Anaerolineales bacterium]HRV95439.1 cation:proton antiporter [Anaerolineae bacterium]